MKELTKKEKHKILENAKKILIDENICMCWAFKLSWEDMFGGDVYFMSKIRKNFPEFNFETAVKKFNADGDKEWVWWNYCRKKSRLEYFDYLIKLYSE